MTLKFVFGNFTDVNGAPSQVIVHFENPLTYVSAKAGPGVDAIVPPGGGFLQDVFLQFNRLAAHSVGGAEITFKIQPGFRDAAINVGTTDSSSLGASISLPNGRRAELPAGSIYVYKHAANGDLKTDLASAREQIVLSAVAGLGADPEKALQDPDFAVRAAELTESSYHFSCGGADILSLDNGAAVVPILDGKVLVVSPDHLISDNLGGIVSHDGGTLIATGAAESIKFSSVPGGTGPMTVAELLPATLQNLAAQGSNILNVGGLNLIGHDGASILPNVTAGLINQDGAGLAGKDGAKLVGTAAFKNLVAGFANVKVNTASLGGKLGLSVDAARLAGVARGGHLLTASGGVVAQGAGNLSGASPGQLSSNSSSRALSFSHGANLISGSSGKLIGDGGNTVTGP